MALVNPHPALKVAVPECPMVDGWKGDDWFHNGAFRQDQLRLHLRSDDAARQGRADSARRTTTTTQLFLRLGSAGAFGHHFGIDALPLLRQAERSTRRTMSSGAARRSIGFSARALKVPTLFVTSLWDQEDMYGGVHALYRA